MGDSPKPVSPPESPMLRFLPKESQAGTQLSLTPHTRSSQHALEPTEERPSTANKRSAPEPTDQRMDQLELHAPDQSQPLTLTTRPTPLETLPQPPPVSCRLPQRETHSSETKFSSSRPQRPSLTPPSTPRENE